MAGALVDLAGFIAVAAVGLAEALDASAVGLAEDPGAAAVGCPAVTVFDGLPTVVQSPSYEARQRSGRPVPNTPFAQITPICRPQPRGTSHVHQKARRRHG